MRNNEKNTLHTHCPQLCPTLRGCPPQQYQDTTGIKGMPHNETVCSTRGTTAHALSFGESVTISGVTIIFAPPANIRYTV